MKGYYKLIASYFCIVITIWIIANTILINEASSKVHRDYRVQCHRLEQEIEEKGDKQINLSQYPALTKVSRLTEEDDIEKFFEGGNQDYVIRQINGQMYRFDYEGEVVADYKQIVRYINIGMLVILICSGLVVVYVHQKLIKPLQTINELPYELSKGYLRQGLKEDKNKYFGKLIWGLDLLREKLETQKEKELQLQKQKKMMVLSISHDIKTPLSAIKLYATALTRGIYKTEAKKVEVATHIHDQAEVIERFILELIETSSEDFLHLEVKSGEFYIDTLVAHLTAYYKERLELYKIPLKVQRDKNCIVKGDFNRAVEVLQNIMENAIKYGDGKGIELRVKAEEECVLLRVTNRGCTLGEGEIPHLFDSFFRGSNVGSNKGSGLGLYICRELMNKMDGHILASCKGDEIEVVVVFRK